MRRSKARRRARPRAQRLSAAETKAVQAAVNQGKRQAHEVLALRKAKPLPEAGSLNGLLIAEGDSWFDYPFNSVLGELENLSYEIESVAHRGDTAEEMAYDASQLAKLAGLFEKLEQRGEVPRAILLSGGGNDVAGNELAVVLNHKQSGLPAVNEEVARGVIVGRLRIAMASLIGALTELSRRTFGRKVPVLVHGYDYPVPDGRGYIGGFWVLPGPWLEPAFRLKGYADMNERARVMTDLIDRFNDMVASLAGQPGLEHVTYVNLRRTLSNELEGKKYKKLWANELHPTDLGFKTVAAEFHKVIATLPLA
jgi:lysophospholipase L1-like esterase